MSVVVPDGTTIAKGAGWRQFRTSPGCSSCSKRFESGVEMVPPPGDGTHHLSQLEIDAAAGGNRGRTEIGTDFGTRRFWMEPRKRRKTRKEGWGDVGGLVLFFNHG